jgi:tetratricopeptide (TPR) repeat protein
MALRPARATPRSPDSPADPAGSPGSRIAALILAGILLAAPAPGCSSGGSSELALSRAAKVEFDEHLQRGLELARQGLDEGAEAEFRRCVQLDPGDARARTQLGRLLAAKAKREGKLPREAAEHLHAAVEKAPGDLQARYELAEILRERWIGLYDPERAIRLYEGILKDRPEQVDVRLQYATWLTVGEVRLGYTVFQPEGAGATATLGKERRVTMDSAWTMDAARFQLEKVLDQVPPESELAAAAHLMMANVLMKSGAWIESVREADLVLTRHPGLPPERRVQALGFKATALYRQERYRESLAVAREAYDLSPTNRALWEIHQAAQSLGGYPADLPAKYRFPLRAEPSGPGVPPPPKFRDIAPRLGIDKFAGAGPASWADFDLDGLYDLLACGCDTFCSLYRNEGERFRDVTLAAGLGDLESGFGAAWGDFDGDGRPDLYVARNGWNGPAPDTLLRNRGDGTFEDVTRSAGITEPGSGFHVTWLDYDRDGWLDLFVSNGVTLDPNVNRLWRNRGDGTFEDVTGRAGLLEKPQGGTIGVAVGDVDGDGWPDLFLHGRNRPNRLYRNRGDGTFEETARQAGVAGNARQNGYVAILHDMDSDGDLDLLTFSLALWENVVTGYRADYRPVPDDDLTKYYRNEGNAAFTDWSEKAGFVYPIGTMAANVADLDNDGYADVYFGTGNPDLRRLEPNLLYHNVGRGAFFVDRTRAAGVGNLGKGHGITFLDWDGDGDLEIYAEMGGFYHGDLWHSAFYRNDTKNTNHYLQVDLAQDGPNRLAVGAGVTVKAGALRTYQEVTAGRGFGSSDPPTLHFGLGTNSRIESVRVRWPDGTVSEISPPPVDRRIRIRKGETGWTTVSVRK